MDVSLLEPQKKALQFGTKGRLNRPAVLLRVPSIVSFAATGQRAGRKRNTRWHPNPFVWGVTKNGQLQRLPPCWKLARMTVSFHSHERALWAPSNVTRVTGSLGNPRFGVVKGKHANTGRKGEDCMGNL